VTPSFFDFLDAKPLYYKAFDPERIHRAYARIREQISHPPVIHIVGTNGKGSTGRMIAHLARSSGVENGEWRVENATDNSQFSTLNFPLRRVGHYSSPHILRFNERIWIDGEEVSDGALEEGHRRLYAMLGAECAGELSYFEYTTLLALLLFESCDLVVLEAGLGGEYDATGVAENRILTVVTPIGLDHREFLGESVEAIAATKLRSVPEGGRALLAPQPHPEVYRVAEEILAERKARLYRMDEPADSLNAQSSTLNALFEEKPWPPFLQENARTALRALELVGIPADPEAVRNLELFGRYYPLGDNVRIDVGHNPLAARALARVLEPGTVLIYNALADKEYAEVLALLAPKIKRVELIPIETERAAPMEALQRVLEELEIPWSCFDGQLFSHERYLVFGSFHTVEAFLKAMGYN
jgi:dihydrofolate synthase/folylpolyglutamate synthase